MALSPESPTTLEANAGEHNNNQSGIQKDGEQHQLPNYKESQQNVRSAAEAASALLTSTVHESCLADENTPDHKWLILRTHTRPRKPESLPIFVEGLDDRISGEVVLDLGGEEDGEGEGKSKRKRKGGTRSMSAKSISISLIGGTTFVGQDESEFLKETQVLWTPPLPPPQRESEGKKKPKLFSFFKSSSNNSPSTNLPGKQTWSFSFPLPKEISVRDGHGGGGASAAPAPTEGGGTSEENNKDKKTYPLPPTFTERASPVYVDYRLLLEIKRGFLKVDKTLRTSFGYHINPIVAESPSILRQLAYADGGPLLGPTEDPIGWKVLAPVQIKGTLQSNNKPIQIELAIANPTTYPLGSPVPLHLALKNIEVSDDQNDAVKSDGDDDAIHEALDLLARPEAIGVELVRSIATGSDAVNDDGVGRSDNHFFESEGLAFWWVPPQERQGGQRTKERTIRGEIEIPKTLKPTFVFPRCSVRYSLDLLPLAAPGWVNSVETQDALLSERITVVARQAPGIRVRSDAPPGYDRSSAANYLKSVGLLENGNQRFLHRHR